MFCIQCGAKLPDNAIFCMSCGTKIVDQSMETEELRKRLVISLQKKQEEMDETLELQQPEETVPNDLAQTEAMDEEFDFDLPEPITIPANALSASELIDLIEERAFRKLQKSSEYHEYFHPCRNFKDNSERQQYDKIRMIYHQAEKQKELFLFFYDNTFLRNGKEGFLMTDKGIHFVSERFQSGFIAYSDIQDLKVVSIKLFPNIIINDKYTLPLRFLTDDCYELCDDLQEIVIPLLKKMKSV